ncbi:bifunctional 4-hydroxy-2-oxoglutarate aldolase/2-dehydro-3-deoxy-phosphogluconate aldolase [Enterococcus saccharolyticus]|uniref:Bifunctional 2-keto-4-hydroxyglutarate aldolase/2-keto-3-deoxy-6-phosphogluconate aldolase n=1 Tax=Candidatus Enterococcus willemsii TaxID=1857215 RepID=A0ABQ6Z1X2_9ENTE|nr:MULTISPECIES: bifunctional 4-hydroxy-2-oxoglutarate aldolase/2-dehydro-3-deoxy-phosphogluconate aldolase [Enterococcus]KAF1305396.1 bifunctional 2-keto-4-hydroxyglutarate aldolase/2-keto-3-deoxy-6-phosphogluconate aldolase [Enterococcus sp. CU12B]MCD5001041.1 bifunctional 4-hydroxy-2-oxoglutarate aldolase/2-dehydro-3-deoxy-phosphogluconate aldolase [Enterococcus saccharolyticus]
MKKVEILNKIAHAGIVAVIRGETSAEAIKSSQAILAGGIQGIEVTFTVPQAETVIYDLQQQYQNHPEIVIGAGTVLDAVTARIAISAGAQFIVSPCFDKETAKLCNLYQVPYLPGCMTITEIKTALSYGADIIKLFPGNLSGPSAIKAFRGPLPTIEIMPTGGVSLENLHEWFEAGSIAVGVGGNLLAPAKNGDFDKMTVLAQQYYQRYQEVIHLK